ncbi:hypothetical protein QI30_03795 [Kurthia sp. 3B1D]|uniref:Uncharacterized protein n=1 Tax=Candidatus Kurthia intestinigallinarum TaxID=1562256 RepID=A0A433RWZ8_9BACL|nr:hypothetical protein QI30_03795 [Kurthia sp. 3B1D]
MYDGFFSYSAQKTTYYFLANDVILPGIPAKGIAALYDGRTTEKTLKNHVAIKSAIQTVVKTSPFIKSMNTM